MSLELKKKSPSSIMALFSFKLYNYEIQLSESKHSDKRGLLF